ncbi:hypothetical protein ABK040_015045 [Willaertia magna]
MHQEAFLNLLNYLIQNSPNNLNTNGDDSLKKGPEKPTDTQNGPIIYYELIINGDFLEQWLDKFNEKPKTFSEIISSQNLFGLNMTHVFSQLSTLSENMKVTYILGNHDIFITKNEIKKILVPKYKFNTKNFRFRSDLDGPYYPYPFIRIEHGHFYDIYSARDPAQNIIPIGYYISRAATEKDIANKVTNVVRKLCLTFARTLVSTFSQGASPFVRILLSNALSNETQLTDALYNENREKEIKGGCFHFTNHTTNVKLGLIQRKYNGWIRRFNDLNKVPLITEKMVDASCGDYSFFLQNSMDPIKDKIVILGHTHVYKLKEYTNAINGAPLLYANSGAWVDDLEKLTAVRVFIKNHTIYTGVEYPYRVEILQWNHGRKDFDILQSKNIEHYFTKENLMLIPELFPYISIPQLLILEPAIDENRNETLVDSYNFPYVHCSLDFLNSKDGCDCNCGLVDLDCVHNHFNLTTNSVSYNSVTFNNTIQMSQNLQRFTKGSQLEILNNNETIYYCDCIGSTENIIDKEIVNFYFHTHQIAISLGVLIGTVGMGLFMLIPLFTMCSVCCLQQSLQKRKVKKRGTMLT